MRPGLRLDRWQRGFTLLELMLVVAILAIVASIGIPQYVSALRTARIGKAKHELVTISHAIGAFTANHEGKLPLTLYQVGFGGKRDPWGVPYCYLNYADGTGDGLDWAIDAGLVDPSAFGPIAAGGSAGGSGGGPSPAPGGGGDGGSGAPQAPVLPVTTTKGLTPAELNQVATNIGRNLSLVERAALSSAVAEYGTFSLFTSVAKEPTRRRDRYMFPLNTDFDLFSLGPDGLTAPSIGESVGLDDVIRANNGGFFGTASEY